MSCLKELYHKSSNIKKINEFLSDVQSIWVFNTVNAAYQLICLPPNGQKNITYG